MLTRVTSFTPGVLPSEDLELEYNNIVNYINNRGLTNPLSANLDFADLYTITNLRTFWNVVNVSEFATLAAAEAQLPSTGGILYVPPQTTIDISSTVSFSKDNTWLVGGGPSSILRRATGTFAATQNAMLLFNGRSNCGIKDLQLDGQQAVNSGTTGLCAARVMGSSNNFRFTGNYVRRWGDNTEANTSPNDGLLIGADEVSIPGRVTVLNNVFENIRRSPVRVMNARYGVVADNICIWDALNGVGGGVHLETPASGNGRLQHLSVLGNTVQGIGATLPSQGIVFVGGPGTPSVDASRCTIVGNTINNIAGEGVKVSAGMLVTVLGNTIGDSLQSGTAFLGGIDFLNCLYSGAAGNVLQAIASAVSNSLGCGIRVSVTTGTIGFIQITGNIVRETAHGGIWAVASGTSTMSGVKIQNNTVTRYGRTAPTTSHGIVTEVDNTATIAGCDISHNRVTLDGTTPNPAVVNGIMLEQTGGTFARATILGNDLEGSTAGTGSKILVTGTIADLDVSHNQEG